MELNIPIVRLRPDAVIPAPASDGAAGMDLTAALSAPMTLRPHGRAAVPTGIAIALPSRGYAALVFARSGLSLREGLTLANGVGVIDSDYRGEILVSVANLGDTPVTIAPGQRIAQLVVVPVCPVSWKLSETLDGTARGSGGFGSTGVD